MKNKYKKYINATKYYRIVGIVFFISSLIYLHWLINHLNTEFLWLSIPFFLAQFYTFILVSLSIINHWKARYRTDRPFLPTPTPPVAIIMPTLGEPREVLEKTIKSFLHLSYPGKIAIFVSNDSSDPIQKGYLEEIVIQMNKYWNKSNYLNQERYLHLVHTKNNNQYKAGNLNQALVLIKKDYPDIEYVLTQDADEIAHPDLLKATIGYFSDPKVAYVQTIKQAKVIAEDPFGNQDLMWFCRTAPARDADNAMFACGSGVIWRISAVDSVCGFSTWNLVEDLTTSYNILANGWSSRFHFEALSEGLAPDDLPNFIKQRGTWAMDTMRIFFWDNPIFKKGLSFKQKLQFLETSLFYLYGFTTIIFVGDVALSLFLRIWPTDASALVHAVYLFPSFLSMEIYFVMLADKIQYRRVKQYWIGLSPYFVVATLKALFYGPNKKPSYKVTRKTNKYGNYLNLVIPQIIIVGILILSLIITFTSTPLYSGFDWATFFWAFYISSFYFQIIKVSVWKWKPEINTEINNPINKDSVTKVKEKIIENVNKVALIPKTAINYIFSN